MMYCYNCSHPLDETGVCPACGKDVRLYKKALFISNKYYNDGLEKALTRNLSGAVESLRQSVKFNKANIDARNLLGLVYFEMGEVVLALGEWVISKNLQPERNLSGRYLNVMRSNPGKLENMNQAVKKFNQGLVYCENGSLDLAVIQLKKVLSINPKFVKAHQLLALLYLNAQSWGKAKSQLMKCMKVDNGSVLTQRYMHEADKMMLPEERRQVANEKKKAAGNAVEEKHGNETIIKPVHRFKATSGFNISGLIVGLVLGIAFAVFLILPARVQQITEERKEALTAISEESDAKSAKILEYETRIAALESEKDTLTADIAALETSGDKTVNDALMSAVNLYLADATDIENISLAMEPVTEESLEDAGEDFQALYETLIAGVGKPMADRYYNAGYASYRANAYEEAIASFTKCCQYDKENADARYFLGMSHYALEDTATARRIFDEVMSEFPNSQRASQAESALAEINNAND
ncbi:MAG: tetratricopeptide repeat protein [Lachnospiraceae bacterium]|nr:tetratricopeptide repeat protein [Lachnospiraceae bacterium]